MKYRKCTACKITQTLENFARVNYFLLYNSKKPYNEIIDENPNYERSYRVTCMECSKKDRIRKKNTLQ